MLVDVGLYRRSCIGSRGACHARAVKSCHELSSGWCPLPSCCNLGWCLARHVCRDHLRGGMLCSQALPQPPMLPGRGGGHARPVDG